LLAQYSDHFQGYSAFARAYADAVRSGRSMDTIAPISRENSDHEIKVFLDTELNTGNGHKSSPPLKTGGH
jgi:hypothetical protein